MFWRVRRTGNTYPALRGKLCMISLKYHFSVVASFIISFYSLKTLSPQGLNEDLLSLRNRMQTKKPHLVPRRHQARKAPPLNVRNAQGLPKLGNLASTLNQLKLHLNIVLLRHISMILLPKIAQHQFSLRLPLQKVHQSLQVAQPSKDVSNLTMTHSCRNIHHQNSRVSPN